MIFNISLNEPLDSSGYLSSQSRSVEEAPNEFFDKTLTQDLDDLASVVSCPAAPIPIMPIRFTVHPQHYPRTAY